MVENSVFVNETFWVLPNPYALTIKPRLEYSIYLIGMILEKLEQEFLNTHDANSQIYVRCSDDILENLDFRKQVEFESSLMRAMDVLNLAQNRLHLVSRISNIAEFILPLVFMIRIVNSNLYDDLSQTRNDLAELSTSLGSIVMDSGSLLEATFDFKQTNLESKQILDEVNLIVDSKIRKQYPNLNF